MIVDSALRLADFGADEMGKQFLGDRVPPAYSEEEKADTSEGQPNAAILPDTMVRLSRDGIARIVVEGDNAIVYHCGDNDRKYHGVPLSPLEFELDDAPTIECLFKTVAPRWIAVKDLPHPPAEDHDDKMDIVKALFEEGIIAVRQFEGFGEKKVRRGEERRTAGDRKMAGPTIRNLLLSLPNIFLLVLILTIAETLIPKHVVFMIQKHYFLLPNPPRPP